MSLIKYKIIFFSEWHIGSGRYSDIKADMKVLKNQFNLPYVPGKTFKGLLRQAAEEINSLNEETVTSDFIQLVFGARPSSGEREHHRFGSKCFFSNAEIDDRTSSEIINQELSGFLFNTVTSTKIDGNGVAVDSSLRQMEVSIPLTLYGKIIDFPDVKDYERQLECCLSFVKRMGVNRNRGKGRCLINKI